jgi:hypothetical protein
VRRPIVVIGRCEVCGRPVGRMDAAKVVDPAVTGLDGRPYRRLAHRGECAAELRHRLGGIAR